MTTAAEMTPEQLRAMAEHVVFEFRMWDWARRTLLGDPEITPERNAAIDAYLLHGRNLLDFLTNNCSKADDVAALHYLPGWMPRNNDPDIAAAVRFAREQLNKRFAHLTTGRLHTDSLPDAHQAWSQLGIMLLAEWERFLQGLPAERWNWFTVPYSAPG